MLTQKKELMLGLGVFALSIALLIVIIPETVVSPGVVANAVLAPSFWPNVVSGMMCLIGGLMVVQRMLERSETESSTPVSEVKGKAQEAQSSMETAVRMLWFVAMLVGYYSLIPVIGLPASSVAAFLFFSLFQCRSTYRMTVLSVGLILPLILYVFFFHIAGVDIPQGDYWRLP
ncbi:MAG: tripartite tricarboxylate transporter TctB family protein [Motiliproteus sp.]